MHEQGEIKKKAKKEEVDGSAQPAA
jgi:hypothetical protein